MRENENNFSLFVLQAARFFLFLPLIMTEYEELNFFYSCQKTCIAKISKLLFHNEFLSINSK